MFPVLSDGSLNPPRMPHAPYHSHRVAASIRPRVFLSKTIAPAIPCGRAGADWGWFFPWLNTYPAEAGIAEGTGLAAAWRRCSRLPIARVVAALVLVGMDSMQSLPLAIGSLWPGRRIRVNHLIHNHPGT